MTPKKWAVRLTTIIQSRTGVPKKSRTFGGADDDILLRGAGSGNPEGDADTPLRFSLSDEVTSSTVPKKLFDTDQPRARWTLATSLLTSGNHELADTAYQAAFDAEPTNPQILWERAQNLRRLGRTASAQAVVRRIVDGTWQPRFQGLVNQARAQSAP